MTDNMFDKFVREKLKDHQSDVPNGLWEKIEQRKDKDRKSGFLSGNVLLTGLMFLIIIAGIGYVMLQDTGDNAIANQVNETPAKSIVSLDYDNESSINKKESLDNEGKQDDLPVNENQNEITSNKLEKSEQVSSTNLIDESEDSNSALSKPSRNYSIQPSRKKFSNRKNSSLAKRNNYHETELSVQELNSVSSINNESQKTYAPFLQGKTAYNLTNLGKFDADKNYNLSELRITGIDCPPNSRQGRNDWYLEVYGSPDVAFKSVKSIANTGYISKKDSSETQQLSYSAGFRISKSIGENLLIKTGLQYSQINERFDLRTENERRITTVITIRTIIGQSGADSTIRDTTSVEQIGYRVQRTYNKYRSLDIPLLLSYEFGNDNLKFAVNAGAIINLHSWYSGNTLNDSLAVVSINSKSSGIYKQNIGVGLYAGFSIIKPVSNRFDVFLEPYFRYNFSNMSKTASYSQRFNAAGVSFGIRYKINRQRSGMN